MSSDVFILNLLLRLLLIESSVIFLCIFFDAQCANYWLLIILEKLFFPIKRKQRVNNCFKPLILSVFTTVAFRLKLEQKETEKYILKLNTAQFKRINP